jgi:hypothetical protein
LLFNLLLRWWAWFCAYVLTLESTMKLKFMNTAAPLQVNWPVVIEAPADDGAVTKDKVTVRFEIIGAVDAQKLLTPSTETILADVMDGADSDSAVGLLKRVIVSWNEADFGAPFSAEALDNLLTYPFARRALISAYGDAAQGRKAKN